MIHAFLITIAVLAAIYAWPFIVTAFCLCIVILTSKWFWFGVLGLTLFIVGCAFIGPAMFLLVGGAYLIWRLTWWGELFKSRKAHKEALLHQPLPSSKKENSAEVVAFLDPGPGLDLGLMGWRWRPSLRRTNKLETTTNSSVPIDWNKL